MIDGNTCDRNDEESVESYKSIAQKEIGLINQYNSFIEMEKALKSNTISYTGRMTKKTRYLKKIDYIDFNPSAKEVKDNVEVCQNGRQNEIRIRDLFFSNTEKVLFEIPDGCEITFKNCIFMGKIRFHNKVSSLYFDNCFSVFMDFSKSICNNLEIVYSLIKELKIQNSECNEIKVSVSNCIIDGLDFINFNGETVEFFCNKINHIYIHSCHNPPLMDSSNFRCFSDRGIERIKEKQIKELVGFSSKTVYKHSPVLIETLNYIQKLNIISEDAGLCCEIDYLKNIAIRRALGKRIILFLCGYFMRPGRIIAESLLVIIVFALLKMLLNNNVRNVADCLCCFEYSFLSFIGIAEHGTETGLRFLFYIESLFGFLLMNIFTISLAKKYLK